MHGIRGHDQRLIDLAQLQLDVDELIREQLALGVVERGLGLDRARGRVDGVVQRIELALGQHLLLLAVPEFDGHELALAQLLGQHTDMGLGDGENSVDGANLGDRHQSVGIGRIDHVAEVGLAQTQAARDGSRDPGIAQLQLGRIDLPLIGRHRALQLAHQCGLGIDLLAGNRVLCLQLLVALQIQLRILELGLIACQRALHLRQRGGKTARVDLGKQLTGLDFVTFLEVQLEQLARDLGTHHSRGTCIHGADGADEHAHITLLHHTYAHRLSLAHATGASRPHATIAPGTCTGPARSLFRSCSRRRIAACTLLLRIPPIATASGCQGDHHRGKQCGPDLAQL
ncbi:hypothetical protein SDC9_127351 [bioreactor metagenome]|uniref:NAD-specific glutamate dehydrogenase n=1 Tax=bioreactor metagenome TaxID=1076179 RepID=A0A645CTS1_9ZZZZ